MITDLFSHKIHASNPSWPDKLVELAHIFAEFDEKVYDRSAIERRLAQLNPRSTYSTRGPSRLRDELGAYPAYLGLYFLETSTNGWILHVSETTKKYLLTEAPDVAAFLRLQLALFQYPNANGAVYRTGSNRLHVQQNAAERTLDIVSKQIHLSPIRLICHALNADASIRTTDLFDAVVTYEEIYALSNLTPVNQSANPDSSLVRDALIEIRSGVITGPTTFERRFRLLEHTGLFALRNNSLSYRKPVSPADEADLLQMNAAILHITNQFNGFDGVTSARKLADVIATADWGYYFDAVRSLPGTTISELGNDLVVALSQRPSPKSVSSTPSTYSLSNRPDTLPPTQRSSRSTELKDPEVTKIKRERQNLTHKLLLDKLHEILKSQGCVPKQNPHIDLYAQIPNDGAFLFEAKSGGDSLLEQIRKGLSQLYEYRYRYQSQIASNPELCLVLGENPMRIPWLTDFLCVDRGILVCWFDKDGNLAFPSSCAQAIAPLCNYASTVNP